MEIPIKRAAAVLHHCQIVNPSTYCVTIFSALQNTSLLHRVHTQYAWKEKEEVCGWEKEEVYWIQQVSFFSVIDWVCSVWDQSQGHSKLTPWSVSRSLKIGEEGVRFSLLYAILVTTSWGHILPRCNVSQCNAQIQMQHVRV